MSRDFVRSIQTPLLIAPDDVPAHPYKVAMEIASLAPNAEVTMYPSPPPQEAVGTADSCLRVGRLPAPDRTSQGPTDSR